MLLAEKTREIGIAASYFICFYLLLNFTSALLQAEKASQKSRERISTSKAKIKQGESKWRKEWLQWLKGRSKWLKRRRRWCCWWSSKLMLQLWSLVAVSCCKHQVFSKKPSYICTGPKWKYRRKALKFAEIAETSRYTPVFWAVRFSPVSVPIQAPEWNIPTVPAGTIQNRLPWK